MKGIDGSRALRDMNRRSRPGGRLRVESLESRCLLATFTVTNTNDSGAGSLRQAILDANGTEAADVIEFAIGTGTARIQVASALPEIVQPLSINGNTQPPSGNVNPRIVIDGTNAGATANGLVIKAISTTVNNVAVVRFGGAGILVDNTSGTAILASHIGVDESGTVAQGNTGNGIEIVNSSNVTIGGTTSAARNIIAGNTGNGIAIIGVGSTGNLIQNAYIGTNATGTVDLGNGGDGININGASNNSIGGTATGQPVTLAFNGGSGVEVLSGNGNSIRQSPIYSNDAVGILLGSGANENIPTPVISKVTTRASNTTVTGTLTGAKPNTQYVIEFFTNTTQGPTGQPQARTFLNTVTVTTNSSGNADITFNSTTPVTTGQFVTATATENTTTRNTSALAAAVQNVTSTNLVVDGSVSPATVAQNGYVTLTYTVRNAGDLAADTTFTSNLPSTLNFVQATSTQGTVSRSGNNLTISLGLINPGATATITILAVPLSTGAINVTGTATSPEDPTTTDNSKTLTVNAVAGIELNVQPLALPNPGTVGQNLTFQYTITNSGATQASNVVLTGTFPTNATFVSSTTTNGVISADAAGGTFTAQIGLLPVNQSAIVRITVRPTATGTVTSTASATGTEPEIFTGNNTASLSVAVNNPSSSPDGQLAPTVTSLRRFGSNRRPTSLVVAYSRAMAEASVEDLANYALVTAGADGRFGTLDDGRIALSTAEYNTTTNEVILTTRRPYSLHQAVQLTINGTTTTAVTSLTGVKLDGNYSGQAGSNFVRRFRAFGPGPIGAPQIARLRR